MNINTSPYDAIVQQYNIEQLNIKHSKNFDCYFVIALTQTTNGPAIGGTRLRHYPNLTQAVIDACRLASGMLKKCNILNLPHGGGKGVITRPKHPFDRNKLLLEYGDFVNSLQGQYIAAVDYGTTPVDMDVVDQSTTFNVCRSEHDNPATYTAQGVYLSIQTVLHHTQRQISDATITIQGFGSVGSRLASLLVNAGCHVITADVSENHTKQAKSIGIDIAKPNDLLNINADVFAPCAVGGVINKETIRAIGAKSICGAANNQLKDDRHDADRLHQQGIIYCPDFIVNSGGLIYASGCHRNDTAETVQARLNTIPNTLNSVLIDSHNRGLSPYQSALSKLHSHHDLSTSV